MRFHSPQKLNTIAGLIGAKFVGPEDFEVLGTNEIHRVKPGDIVFGDLDGVVIIPQRVEKQVILEALEKAAGENVVRNEIENGMSSTAAFKKYGIL